MTGTGAAKLDPRLALVEARYVKHRLLNGCFTPKAIRLLLRWILLGVPDAGQEPTFALYKAASNLPAASLSRLQHHRALGEIEGAHIEGAHDVNRVRVGRQKHRLGIHPFGKDERS
jgi:hypothetical protein